MFTTTAWMRTPLLTIAIATATTSGRAQTNTTDSASRATGAMSEKLTTIRVLPVIGSAPETGFLGGATALRVSSWPTDTVTRPSTEQVYVAYTAKQQFRAFLSTDRWTTDNRWGFNAQIEYQRYPQPFFGIGVDAPASAEEWYDARTALASVSVRRRLTRALYVQTGYRYATTSVRDAEEGGAVERGDLPGMRGGDLSQATGGAAWDSRDNIFAPARGTFTQVTGAWSAEALGSDFDFARYVVDARRYAQLGGGVLAGQAYLEVATGTVPFDQLALLGSASVMRGYARGRYRDRNLAAAQVEYRLPVARRLGVAAFAGAGTVAPSVSNIPSSTLLPSFGGGVRYLLLPKQRTSVRFDYGIGKGSSGIYIAFYEAY